MIKSIILMLIKMICQLGVIWVALEIYVVWSNMRVFIVLGLFIFFNIWQDIVVISAKRHIMKD